LHVIKDYKCANGILNQGNAKELSEKHEHIKGTCPRIYA